MHEKNLLIDKRYWPTYWTQFFGAFNDNVYKNALVMLITYKSYTLGSLTPEMMVSLCGGIFILPFFLFSATAGQVCDKYPKNKLMFYIKVWEILVMIIGALGFYFENIETLLSALFLMGLQSTFFGPIKYSILPELVTDDELVQGNAYVGMGTFVAILLGTILGGVLISIPETGKIYTSIAVIIFAMIGTLFSRGILKLNSNAPDLKVKFGILKPTWEIMKITRETKSIFLSVLGISWFWFLGAALLSMFPVYVKNVIGGNEHVVVFFLALFSIGVAVGNIICERLSQDGLELGLVPLGSFGMSLFILDLYFVGAPVSSGNMISVGDFISNSSNWRIIIDLIGLSIFSGFFTVPLYTFIQQYSPDAVRSRVIAGLNIINALFMVFSAVILAGFYAFQFSIPQIFGILAGMNLIIAIYIYKQIPEFLLRFFCVFMLKLIYRVKVTGHENIPMEGGCILTCNHVSFADWLVVYGAIKRPVRFVMYYKFMKIPIINILFRDAGIIPIAGFKEDKEILDKAMDEIESALNNGDILCIFPEGGITYTGELEAFRTGIEMMLEKSPVPVIPMTLKGLWGSYLSRKYNGKAFSHHRRIFKKWFRKVDLEVFPLWSPKDVSAQKIEEFTRAQLQKELDKDPRPIDS